MRRKGAGGVGVPANSADLEQVKGWDSLVQGLGNASMADVVPRRLSELHWNPDTYSSGSSNFRGSISVQSWGSHGDSWQLTPGSQAYVALPTWPQFMVLFTPPPHFPVFSIFMHHASTVSVIPLRLTFQPHSACARNTGAWRWGSASTASSIFGICPLAINKAVA